MIVDEEIEDFAVLWPFRDQIADGDDAIVRLEIDRVEQIHQLIVATVNVADCDRSAHKESIKQMMYRVDIPVGKVRCDNVRAGGAQSAL